MTLEDAVMATAELCGTRLSEMGARLLLTDLTSYPEPAVLTALARCRKELKGRLTVAEILSRIEDGRPGADEAWAQLPWDEEVSACVTEEMLLAMGAARPAYQNGDKQGARFAFREAYTRLIMEAREQNKPVEWQVTLGYDKAGREAALLEAVAKKQITPQRAEYFLPGVMEQDQAKRITAARATTRGSGGDLVSFRDVLGSILPEQASVPPPAPDPNPNPNPRPKGLTKAQRDALEAEIAAKRAEKSGAEAPTDAPEKDPFA